MIHPRKNDVHALLPALTNNSNQFQIDFHFDFTRLGGRQPSRIMSECSAVQASHLIGLQIGSGMDVTGIYKFNPLALQQYVYTNQHFFDRFAI